MKKVLTTTAMVLGLLGLTGCANNAQPQAPVAAQCPIDGVAAPTWVCDGANMEGGVAVVASAAPVPNGRSFQKEIAISNARNELAKQIAVKVSTMLKQYQATTGQGNDQTADTAIESVSKQVAQQTLTGTKMIHMWPSPKGTLYVLVGMPDQKAAKESIKKAVKTSLQNNKALWQEFKAKKAQEELDATIEKEFGGAAK